jgi:hypothetical protein
MFFIQFLIYKIPDGTFHNFLTKLVLNSKFTDREYYLAVTILKSGISSSAYAMVIESQFQKDKPIFDLYYACGKNDVINTKELLKILNSKIDIDTLKKCFNIAAIFKSDSIRDLLLDTYKTSSYSIFLNNIYITSQVVANNISTGELGWTSINDDFLLPVIHDNLDYLKKISRSGAGVTDYISYDGYIVFVALIF